MGGFRDWRRYRQLEPAWREIVFYAETGQDWHHFAPLIAELNDALGRRVTYVSSDPSDPGLAHTHALYRALCIPEGWFLTLHFQFQRAGVVVLTMMDLGNLNLKRSINPVHYVYVFHSMGSTHMVDHANSYDAYDSLFCVGPHHVAELRRREELAGLAPRALFHFGHPRLEALLAQGRARQDAPGDVPTVLVAPTWGEDAIFNRCGRELLRALLDDGLKVIMRPHYHTRRLTPAVLEALVAEFGSHPRFEVIERMGESDSLFRSDLLVSDWSAMAIEYALGLEKPVLFVDLPRRIRNPQWQDWGLEPFESAIRGEAGEIIAPADIAQAPAAVRRLLAEPGRRRARLQALRERSVYHPEGCVPFGAAEIARLADAQESRAQPGRAHG